MPVTRDISSLGQGRRGGGDSGISLSASVQGGRQGLDGRGPEPDHDG